MLVYEDLSIDFLVFLVKTNAKNKYIESRIRNRDEIYFRKVALGVGGGGGGGGAKIPVNLHTFTA